MRAEITIAVAITIALAARSADACQPPLCSGGHLIPAGDFPISLPAFYWSPEADAFSDPPIVDMRAVLTQQDGRVLRTRLEPASHGWWIVAEEAFVAGSVYNLELSRHCVRSGTVSPERFELVARDADGLPTSAGLLFAEAQRIESIHLADGSGACSRQVRSAFVDVHFRPDEPAWTEAFFHKTLVDGVEYTPSSYPAPIAPGSSWMGRGADRIYTVCEAPGPGVFNHGVGEGRHLVTMSVSIPGSSQSWLTEPLEVILDCDPASADGGASSPDAESTARSGDLELADPSCGCHTTGHQPSTGWAAVALLALQVGLRRRR